MCVCVCTHNDYAIKENIKTLSDSWRYLYRSRKMASAGLLFYIISFSTYRCTTIATFRMKLVTSRGVYCLYVYVCYIGVNMLLAMSVACISHKGDVHTNVGKQLFALSFTQYQARRKIVCLRSQGVDMDLCWLLRTGVGRRCGTGLSQMKVCVLP